MTATAAALLLLLRPLLLLLLLLGGRRDFRDRARRAKPVDPHVRLEGPIQLPHGQGLVDLLALLMSNVMYRICSPMME